MADSDAVRQARRRAKVKAEEEDWVRLVRALRQRVEEFGARQGTMSGVGFCERIHAAWEFSREAKAEADASIAWRIVEAFDAAFAVYDREYARWHEEHANAIPHSWYWKGNHLVARGWPQEVACGELEGKNDGRQLLLRANDN